MQVKELSNYQLWVVPNGRIELRAEDESLANIKVTGHRRVNGPVSTLVYEHTVRKGLPFYKWRVSRAFSKASNAVRRAK